MRLRYFGALALMLFVTQEPALAIGMVRKISMPIKCVRILNERKMDAQSVLEEVTPNQALVLKDLEDKLVLPDTGDRTYKISYLLENADKKKVTVAVEWERAESVRVQGGIYHGPNRYVAVLKTRLGVGGLSKINLKYDSTRDTDSGRTIRFVRDVDTPELQGQIVVLMHVVRRYDRLFDTKRSYFTDIVVKFVPSKDLDKSATDEEMPEGNQIIQRTQVND